MKYLLEICTDTYESAKNADSAGADRIELCTALESGGLTPSYGLTEVTVNTLKIKVNVLIRPRPGDFCYSAEEFEIMCKDILMFKTLNINGIVSGILLKNGEIDVERTKYLVELSKPLEFTFHRAFDRSFDTVKAIEQVIETGANRLLTSGGEPNVDLGVQTIINLHKNNGDRISIMPGGGLNETNIKELQNSGIQEFHLSATVFVESKAYQNSKNYNMGNLNHDNKCGYKYSSIEKIKTIMRMLQE